MKDGCVHATCLVFVALGSTMSESCKERDRKEFNLIDFNIWDFYFENLREYFLFRAR